MHSVSKHRRDYKLTYKEVEQLTRASHKLNDKRSGIGLATQVWKRIGKNLRFYYETVGPPVKHNPKKDIRWFSAIPFDTELTTEELQEAGVTLENIKQNEVTDETDNS